MHFGNIGHFPLKKKSAKWNAQLVLHCARRGEASPGSVPVGSSWSGLILWLSRESIPQPDACLWSQFISRWLWRKHHMMSDKAARLGSVIRRSPASVFSWGPLFFQAVCFMRLYNLVLTHLVNSDFLTTHFVAGTVLGSGDSAVSKYTQSLCYYEPGDR